MRKTRKSKKPNGTFIELNGEISIIERKKGKLVSREKLDGNVMLECLRHFIVKALESAIARG